MKVVPRTAWAGVRKPPRERVMVSAEPDSDSVWRQQGGPFSSNLDRDA
jgi:hypothetical protein